MVPGGARLPRHVYVEGDFYPSIMSARSKPLLVTSEQISWDDKSMKFDRVTGFAYYRMTHTRSPAPKIIGYNYSIILQSDETRRFVVSLFGFPNDQKVSSAFQRVIGALRTHVETRILGELLQRIDRGDPVKIGSLTFSREGLYKKSLWRSKSVSWSQTLEFRPPSLGIKYESSIFIYTRNVRGRRRMVGEISSITPNAVLVPTIINHYVTPYSRLSRVRTPMGTYRKDGPGSSVASACSHRV